jgi:hypothetical protein
MGSESCFDLSNVPRAIARKPSSIPLSISPSSPTSGPRAISKALARAGLAPEAVEGAGVSFRPRCEVFVLLPIRVEHESASRSERGGFRFGGYLLGGEQRDRCPDTFDELRIHHGFTSKLKSAYPSFCRAPVVCSM